MPTKRRYVSSADARARKNVLAAAKTFSGAQDARDAVLREEYATGVDVRDLVDLLQEGGAPLSRQQVHRIVKGARAEDTE